MEKIYIAEIENNNNNTPEIKFKSDNGTMTGKLK